MPAGDNILLVRRNTNVPILEVSSGGAVKTIRVGAPKGFLLSAVFPSKSEWVVRFVKNYDKGGMQFVTAKINPNDGTIQARFGFKDPLGVGLACASDEGLKFIKQSSDGLSILVGSVTPSQLLPTDGVW